MELKVINKMVKAEFKPIWEESGIAGRSAAFALCNKIRKATGSPAYSLHTFDEGWQYRTIFHEDYDIACDEFVNLVFGWW